VTNNKFVSRILDGEYDGDFRNFRIIIDEEGATDEVLEACEVSIEDFSIVIYDNVSVVEQDYMLVPVGAYVSEDFDDEVMQLGQEDTTHIIKFGKPVKAKKEKAEKGESKEKKSVDPLLLEEGARNKFKTKEVDIREKIRKLPNMKFPTYEEFELLEGAKVLPNVDRNMFKLFFGILEPLVGVKEPYYLKEVTRTDANSGSIEPNKIDR
jgi:hypothetical protein